MTVLQSVPSVAGSEFGSARKRHWFASLSPQTTTLGGKLCSNGGFFERQKSHSKPCRRLTLLPVSER